MNKNVLALAVAGALAAPTAALAQVTIGGGITVLFYNHDADNDSDASSHDRMESSESEINIRGEEKLGGGLSVWFQCASSADGVIGGTTETARVLCARNSAIGFRGDFGNVFFGNWDTPLKLVQNRARGWFSGTNALYGGGFTLLAGSSQSGAANTGISFYRRQANSVNYHSPNWSGFTIAAAFSASNEGADIPDAQGSTPRLLSLNGIYTAGPLLLAVGYEKHDDFAKSGATALSSGFSPTDDNLTLVAGYRFGGFNIRGVYSKSTYESSPTAEVEVTGFGVYADFNIQGPHTLRAAYVTVDDVEGTAGASVRNAAVAGDASATYTVGANTGGDLMTLAYSYDFSKRTQGVIAYNRMESDTAARFSMGVAQPTAGGKQSSFGVALKHSF